MSALRKIKVGTQFDPATYERLKVAAAREGRPVGALLHDAVTSYLRSRRQPGLRRFLDRRPALAVPAAEAREILEADFYEQ